MRLIRGRTLTFLRRPESIDDTDAWRFEEDGALLVRDGRIVDAGPFRADHGAACVIDHRPHLILPGLIDAHIHFPQVEVLGAYAAGLLDWLTDHTFPAEARFSDPAHAAAMAEIFFDALIRNGTTSVAAFCSVHPESVDAFFAAAATRNMAVHAGKTMMDRGVPAAVRDTPASGFDESAALLARWHRQGRARYAITPRFAITSSPEQLEAAGALAATHPDCLIQTHMSENRDEIAEVARLFPKARDYLDVYERFGLVGGRTLLGHAIHLTPRERARTAETEAVAVHCPTSNLFLGSGLFDPGGLRVGIASDIGGGTSYSMLRTLDAAYHIQQLRGQRRDPFLAFYEATAGNAAALAEGDIGTLDVGTMADFVVLDAGATPERAARRARVETLADELFLLQTTGDDRAVVETYVAGEPLKAAAMPDPSV